LPYKWSFYTAKAISLTLSNLIGRKKKRSNQFISREYSDQTSDWANYNNPARSLGVQNNQLQYLTTKEKCDSYIELIRKELDEYQFILEAGCGGGVNVTVLKGYYPNKTFFAFDFLLNRVRSAAAIGEKGIKFFTSDIRRIALSDKSVDATYTALVLEQIPQDSRRALDELIRITKFKMILLEPCFEFSNYSQKQYLIYKDYIRSLKSDLETLERESKIRIKKMQKLSSLHNPLNSIGLFVLEIV